MYDNFCKIQISKRVKHRRLIKKVSGLMMVTMLERGLMKKEMELANIYGQLVLHRVISMMVCGKMI